MRYVFGFLRYAYGITAWVLGMGAVLWAFVAGQWLGAILLIPLWLITVYWLARRFGVTG